MTAPIGSFQGLASGIQWRDLVDQIIQVETARALNPVSSAITVEQKRIEGWSALASAVTKARDALVTLRDGSAFRGRSALVGATAAGNPAPATVSSVSGAAPGRYAVEVENLAQSEKLTGLAVADPAAALGITGRFSINGASVTLEATDSLLRIRDKMNAVNTGSAPSRATATVSTAAGVSRLMLNADQTGARGIELADDRSGTGSTSTLEALGFIDGTRTLNTGTDGKVRSMRVSSTTLAAAAALGISVSPSPATILVNGRALTVDLENDSITDIVARINALSAGSAQVETETDGSATWSRIAVGGSFASDGTAGSDLVLEALGMRVGGRSSNITQAITSGTTLTGFGGATATGSTLLVDLGDGSSVGMQAGDVIALTGTDGAGAAVSLSYTVTGTDTMDDLMAAMAGAFSGRAASVSLVNGQLTFTDSVAGDSRLSVQLSTGLQGGDTLDFGTSSTSYGRVRRLAAGEDARIRVDGALLTSRTNTVTNAVGGASLALSREEPGSTFDVTISATPDQAVGIVQDFVKTYNDLVTAVATETKAGGRLQFSSSARATLGAMKGILLADQTGLATGAPYVRAGSLGLALQKTGQLTLDASKLRSALESDPGAVEALFSSGGAASLGTVQYVGAGTLTPSGSYALNVTQAATRSSVLGSAFGAYAASGTPATMTVTAEGSNRATTIAFVNGDTPAVLLARLNAAFQADSVAVIATLEGGALRLTSTEHGSGNGFTVAYADPGLESPATQLGIAAGAHDNGVDAAGTLAGVAMTGAGQLLTGVNGLVVRYTGTDALASTTVRYSRGLAGALTGAANSILVDGDGTAAQQETSARARIVSLERREADITSRLERRRAALIADFTRMETTLSRLQSQGNWLSSQITSIQNISAAANG